MAEASRGRRVALALGIIPVYLLLFFGMYHLIGSFASIFAFLPALLWAILLGRWAGLACGLGLVFPTYLILFQISSRDMGEISGFLLGGHILVGVVSFIVGEIYSLRRSLGHELAERKASEARFRSLFDNTNDAILILSMEMVIQDVNEQAAKILGYTVEEMVGKDHHQIVPAEEREDLQYRLDQLLAGESLPNYERTYIKQDGGKIRVEINAALVFDKQGNPHYIQSIGRDITDRKAAEEKLYYQATHDALTGLYNRNMFFDRAGQALERARRNHPVTAVLFLDLDGFKQANDTHGHAFGDEVLIAAGSRIRAEMRSSDAVARLGGDEFAVLLEDIDSPEKVKRLAERLSQCLAKPYEFDGRVAHVSASIGTSFYPEDGKTVDQLIKTADENMYAAKQAYYQT